MEHAKQLNCPPVILPVTGLCCHPISSHVIAGFIAGSIDFVFGEARAIFDGCTFYMDSMGYAGVHWASRIAMPLAHGSTV